MSFDETLDALPSGLKEARLERIDIQLDKDRVTLTLSIWMGDDKDVEGVAHEIFRRAQIVLDGIVYVVVPPETLIGTSKGYLEVDGEVEPSEDAETELPEARPNVPLTLYLPERNRFLHFGAHKGELRWLDPTTRS